MIALAWLLVAACFSAVGPILFAFAAAVCSIPPTTKGHPEVTRKPVSRFRWRLETLLEVPRHRLWLLRVYLTAKPPTYPPPTRTGREQSYPDAKPTVKEDSK